MPGIQNIVGTTTALTQTYFANINIIRFTSSGTYTPSSTLKFAIVECWGAGGGASWGYTGSSSGGGGSYSCSIFSSSAIGASKSITIGTGGAGATTSAGAGSAGGATSFDTLISCPGGAGGFRSYSTPSTAYIYPNASGEGGTTPSGSGANWINLKGAPGLYGINAAGISIGGIGGPAIYSIGTGAAGRTGVSVSVPANVGTGAGGEGVLTNAAGAAGSNGLVVITEFTLR